MIRILPESVVSRIAAGEVIERPASAVKEMIENAIDAGATEIKVECLEGGRRMIRITDNGYGIRADEVKLAFAHHATSKLQQVEDLEHIDTLGFRGEALASIASVSIVTCITRHKEEDAGSMIRIDNSRVITHERIGRTPGTTMTIEHLFARLPARLKFLKSNQTERGHIDGVVMRYAMAYAYIRFTLLQDGKVILQTTGNNNLRDVLIETLGAEDVERMRDILPPEPSAGETTDEIFVSGYVGLPTLHHPNRSRITLFVNGRPVQDIKLASAVVQAYHTLLMVGRYPVAVVMLMVPPNDVDVNAHPAKAEVRFRDANAVFSALQRAVRKTLLTHIAPPQPPVSVNVGDWGLALAPTPAIEDQTEPDDPANRTIEPNPSQTGLQSQPHIGASRTSFAQSHIPGSETWERIGIARNSNTSAPITPTPNQAVISPAIGVGQMPAAAVIGSPPNLPALRILGQLALSYIIAEGPEGLYLIDQHAAHERILFERIVAQHELGQMVSQPLLDPATVNIPVSSAHAIDDNLAILQHLGFEIEPFGGATYLVRAVPSMMIQDDITAAVRDIVAELELGDALMSTPLQNEIEARILRRVCKRMAIKAGRVLPLAEMQALVRDLEACASPRTCPHGRPTMIQIGVTQLEKLFGRV
jgi:DNA mismatch repair protein MutL